MRDLAAQIFGILSSHGFKNETEFDRCLTELVHDTSNKKTLLEQQHGQLLAMAHAIERSIVILRTSGAKDSVTLQKWSTYKTVILTICKFHTVSLKDFSFVASFYKFWRFGFRFIFGQYITYFGRWCVFCFGAFGSVC